MPLTTREQEALPESRLGGYRDSLLLLWWLPNPVRCIRRRWRCWRARDLAKAVVPIAHGGGSVANPHGPGGFEGRAAAFFRSCRESSTWCELFVAAT